MKKQTKLKWVAVVTLLCVSTSSDGQLFRLFQLSPDELSHPQQLSRNLSTPLGQELFRETDFEKQTDLVRLLSAKAVGDTKDQAGFNFDLGAAYYFGMGVKPDNNSAVLFFIKSFELNRYKAGLSNANWIQFGPPVK